MRKLWHAAARPLPVRLRPIGGETVTSFTRRLAHVNALASSTAILRAIGEPRVGGVGTHLLVRDAMLNAQALDRLETLSGISRERLQRALPGLRHPSSASLPSGQPIFSTFRLHPPARPACRFCSMRADTTSAMVRPLSAPLVCHRHRQWVDTDTESDQLDISQDKAILLAHRRQRRLHAAHADRLWVLGNTWHARRITASWFDMPVYHPELHQRWTLRAMSLRSGASTASVVTFPEAIALAEILSDMQWRRHVAMVQHYQLDIFFRHVAWVLGEPRNRHLHPLDPLRRWADEHRLRFAFIRNRFWAQHSYTLTIGVPFPEIRHFK